MNVLGSRRCLKEWWQILIVNNPKNHKYHKSTISYILVLFKYQLSLKQREKFLPIKALILGRLQDSSSYNFTKQVHSQEFIRTGFLG